MPSVAFHPLRLWPCARQAWGMLCLCLCLTPLLLGAEPSDRQAPMHIEADALHYDEARQTSVFTGNVVATKGSLVLRGQQIEVRQDPAGHQSGVILGSPAQRAFFRQKRPGLDEFMEGEAVRIHYDGLTDTVTFLGQAVLRRYRGAVLSDETQGGRIVYNGSLGTFSVDGAAAEGVREPQRTPRVRAMLSPTPAAAPVQPPATPGGTPLTTSPRLEPRQ